MLYLFGAKKMQTSAKKTCFQFAECSFSYAKIRLFLVISKVFGRNVGMMIKKKRRLSHFENRPILFFMIEKNYFLINSHFAFPYAQAYNLISYVPSASHSQFGPPSRESSLLKSPPQAIFHSLFALNLNCPTAN